MKTVVFTHDTDFTITHDVQTLGDPINGLKKYDPEAIFKRHNKVDGVCFFVPSQGDGYGATQYIKVWMQPDQFLSVAKMIENIQQQSVEDGKTNQVDDDIPF